MARKKRQKKGKKGSRIAGNENHSRHTMSETANTASTMSTRKSSDAGLSSDFQDGGEGTHTEMTSVMGSDEMLGTTTSGVGESEDMAPDNASDGQSTYAPPSEYPTMTDSYRSEMPYGDDVDMLSTRSITEQDLDYRWENGRRYCGPKYHMPNDEYEQVRLSLIHRIYLEIFDGDLTSVPVHNPERVLDIGTGTGDWAIAMADLNPECEVIGTDISAIQPTSVPANCFFEIDDAELEWTREPDSFDLVHFRDLMSSFNDWQSMYREAYRALKPGGWIELADFDDSGPGVKSFASPFGPDSELHEWYRDMAEASRRAGRPRGLAHLNPAWLHRAGFVDIKVTEHVIPINTEAGGGKLWLIAMVDGFEALSLRLLTQYMGWEADRVKQATHNIAREMTRAARHPEKSKHLMVKFRIIVGRKPLHPRTRNARNGAGSSQTAAQRTQADVQGQTVNGDGQEVRAEEEEEEGDDDVLLPEAEIVTHEKGPSGLYMPADLDLDGIITDSEEEEEEEGEGAEERERESARDDEVSKNEVQTQPCPLQPSSTPGRDASSASPAPPPTTQTT